MKDITAFHLSRCPYCIQAKKAIAELIREDPSLAAIPIHWIEEQEDPVTADSYDYYYVPSFFFGKEKQYEAHPGETYEECKKNVERVLRAAL
ncbi:MAG: glutaredoxin [Solobacterium sp.]|nr:glutaredoxin [Solobacterium sp.]